MYVCDISTYLYKNSQVSLGKICMYVCIDVDNATDGQSRQDDFGSSIDAQVQLVIDDLPLGIHNGLILIRIRDAHLCILLFRPTERLN